jgi:hypothetical protein
MQLIVRIRSSLSLDMSMSVLFNFPALKELSAQLDELRQASLFHKIAGGGHDIDELLKRVASMPESQIREWMNELTTGAR